jgi:hypothetical protein
MLKAIINTNTNLHLFLLSCTCLFCSLTTRILYSEPGLSCKSMCPWPKALQLPRTIRYFQFFFILHFKIVFNSNTKIQFVCLLWIASFYIWVLSLAIAEKRDRKVGQKCCKGWSRDSKSCLPTMYVIHIVLPSLCCNIHRLKRENLMLIRINGRIRKFT